MLSAVSNEVPNSSLGEAVAERTSPKSTSKSSWFGRNQQTKSPIGKAATVLPKASVVVDVQLDEAHFRSENEYGLYETLRGRCVLVSVDIR